jgi:hypothetical protein
LKYPQSPVKAVNVIEDSNPSATSIAPAPGKGVGDAVLNLEA